MYNALQVVQGQSMMWVMQIIFIVFIGIFILSFMYALPMMVTYKLKLGQIIRNSLMLALGRLPFTLIFAVLTVLPLFVGLIIFAATGSGFALLGLLIYYGLIGFSLAAFVISSYTNATFDRLMRSDEDRPVDPEDREIKP
jgi:uncharacterized membrane protein YesL